MMRGMFGIKYKPLANYYDPSALRVSRLSADSPERATCNSEAVSPLAILGYFTPSGIPISRFCRPIGLHPILGYFTPSGLRVSRLCRSIALHPILGYFTPFGDSYLAAFR